MPPEQDGGAPEFQSEVVEGPLEDGIPEQDEEAVESEPMPELRPLASDSTSITRYDLLQAYLHEVQRHDLLTPEEEHALAVQYQEHGDVQAAARLVTANLRLVVKIAFEYRRAYRNIMDLIQEGNVGLLQAVHKFDPYREVKLSSYAAWWIRAYILRYILNSCRMVKLGTTQAQRKLFFNLNKERARLTAMGFEITPDLIADRLNVSVQEVVDMDRRLRGADVSLDAPLSDDGGKSVARIDLLSTPAGAQDEELSLDEFQRALRTKLEAFGKPLEGKERFIFEHRLMTDAPLTLQEIGKHFRVSRERIRQIEKRLLERLRTFLLEEMGEHFDVR